MKILSQTILLFVFSVSCHVMSCHVMSCHVMSGHASCYRDAGLVVPEFAELVCGAGGVHRGAHNQCDQVHHRRHGCTGMEYLYLFSHIIKVWLAVQKLKTVFFKQVS